VVRKRSKPEPGDAWAATLRLLTRRDYGTGELRRHLLGKGFPAEAVEAALARGSELGYLDDARYIERLSRRLVETGRAVGPRLAVELRRRALPEELIRATLDELRDAGDEEPALRALIARRFPGFDFLATDDRERRRAVLFLQRRGFALDRILNELKRTDS
jgi:regulatory protein